MEQLQTSNLKQFKEQLDNPNVEKKLSTSQDRKVQKIVKNIVLGLVADGAGCGHYRCIFPMTYLNAVFGKSGKIIPMVSPFFVFQDRDNDLRNT